jgi:hypothetical protein
MAVILCNDTCAASSGYLFSLSAVYYFLLRTVLCLRFFFLILPLTTGPHEVCFQLFPFVRRPLVLYYPLSLNRSSHARLSPLILSRLV